MESKEYIEQYISRARAAQKAFESWDQEGVDKLVRAVARVVYDNAEPLARMAVEETGMGVYEDKVAKNRGKASIIWNSLKGKKSVGIIERNSAAGTVKIAKPVGVVAAITPTTNPSVTPMCNAMFALKGRNAIIITPHSRAIHTSTRTVELINQELARLGAPEHLIQVLAEHSRENTRNLIAAADVVVATGGMGMVKAAYSSGKPAYGVGAGNVQCIIDRGVDYAQAVPKIIAGRSFDNGIICSGEQSVILPREDQQKILDLFNAHGGYVVAREKAGEMMKVIFPDEVMNKDLVGQSAAKVAALAELKVPEGTRVLLIPAERGELLGKEKMCPVLAVYPYDTWEEAVAIAGENLEMEGKGHSVAIHSDDLGRIEQASLALPASRFVINQPSSTSAGGSFFNSFAPTTTLGCGTWGNNSISENLNYHHLLNVSTVGFYNAEAVVPSQEELWGPGEPNPA